MQVTSEVKKSLFKEYGGSEKNTGSTPAQIAMFTERINHISGHLSTNRKDYANTRALIRLVGKRRSLLDYLKAKDIERYRAIVKELDLRR